MKRAEKPAGFLADLHVHTAHSADSLADPEKVVKAAANRGMSAIAVTDHDEISGALMARAIARKLGLALQVIVGEEVGTDEGDLLVYFLKKRIAPGPLSEVLFEARNQNAVCCAAHPFDFLRRGIALGKLPPGVLGRIDAIEVFNARVSSLSQNDSALKFAQMRGKAMLAGSDAHHEREVGAACVEFKGIRTLNASNMLLAQREIRGRLSPKYVHLFSRFAMLAKKLRVIQKA